MKKKYSWNIKYSPEDFYSVIHNLNINTNMNLNLTINLNQNLNLKLNLNWGGAQYSTSEKYPYIFI